jgi:hypothetical protein
MKFGPAVYEVFDGEDVVFPKRRLDDTVVCKGNTLLVDPSISTLVDELTDRFQVGLAGQKLKC